MDSDTRSRCLHSLHTLVCSVGYINDRVTCGDMTQAAGIRKAQAEADIAQQEMQDSGALEAWISAHGSAGGMVSLSWQVLFRNDPQPMHGNQTPKGRC
jgi:hypothetical protein